MCEKINIDSLQEFLFGRRFVFVVGLGFDERCVTVLENIDPTVPERIIGVSNPKASDRYSIKFRNVFCSIARENGEIIGLESTSLLDTVDMVQDKLKDLDNDLELIIDITSFSHELLVALIGLLDNESLLARSTLLYTGAESYSYKFSQDETWLSKGVLDVRSVLGFPGVMLPSRKLHLVVMAGFEVERATEVILRYEPLHLSIGKGGKEISVSPRHHESNSKFVERLKRFLEEHDTAAEDIHHFEFSCIDPIETALELQRHVLKFKKENVVICPLNTKLSTVGAALVGLMDGNIQICYAEAAEYNLEGYASPGRYVTVVKLPELESLRLR